MWRLLHTFDYSKNFAAIHVYLDRGPSLSLDMNIQFRIFLPYKMLKLLDTFFYYNKIPVGIY